MQLVHSSVDLIASASVVFIAKLPVKIAITLSKRLPPPGVEARGIPRVHTDHYTLTTSVHTDH